ncbi:MAG: thioredoxin domain-containing protein [Verrucomicrobia bacterium]|nr:thioredoxin domain-containing protein [Verrucomicrobiota bacterium]
MDLIVLVLALGALGINLLLFQRHGAGGGIAGCGGSSACEELLKSRWSQVFGIPVAGLGCVVYMVLIVTLVARMSRLSSLLCGVIVGAALWFVFVQAVLLGRFCPWCNWAHGLGACVAVLGLWSSATADDTDSVWMRAGVSAAAAVLGIGWLQYYGPLPMTHQMGDLSGADAPQAPGIFARGSGPKAVFADGRRIYDLAAMPHLGPANAKRVLVEFLDSACPSCQTMGGYLGTLLAKHPADLCLVILPVPFDRSCNFSLGKDYPEYAGSCKLARLELAVWRAKPEAFAGFHRAMLKGAAPEDARAKALELLTPTELASALQDPWIDELIQANINDWVALSVTSNKMPKLLVGGKRILHGLPSGEADFIRVMEAELGL